MANHGVVCIGENLDKALFLAEAVEQLARIYNLSLATGEPDILPDDEMARVLEKFAHYGPRET